MSFYLFLAAVALGWFFLMPKVRAFRSQSDEEKSFAIRFGIFTWVTGLLFLAAFMFLPNKGRIIMVLPFFIIAVTLAKWWKKSRNRMRQEAEQDSNFARARRIN